MKVLIVGGGNCAYGTMYKEAGFTLTNVIREANLIQFTGGSDVSPSLYGEQVHPSTMHHMGRDVDEQEFYWEAIRLNIPMVGICRGGQFLNVMNGGKMYQHVNNHGVYGTHEAVDEETQKIVRVTSTHHQMMRPASNAIILCTATLATSKQYMVEDEIKDDGADELDIEAVWYADTKCLCFQPHPEFNRLEIGDTREYFFELLNRYITGEWL